MTLWIHRNLPIVLAATLSLLLHTVVLFPLIEIMGLGRFNSDAEQTSLGRENEGLDGQTRDSELDKKRERRAERERQMQRKLNMRRIEQAPRERPLRTPELRPEDRPDPPITPDDPFEEKVELGIEESDAVTMNWIGYAEYETHLAALAEVEQAALRLEMASGAEGNASPKNDPTPPTTAIVAAAANTDATTMEPVGPPAPSESIGAEAPIETTLLVPNAPVASSPVAASARVDPATTPSGVQGNDSELARPLPPPEHPANSTPPSPTLPNETLKPEEFVGPEQPQPDDEGEDPNNPPATAPRTDPDAALKPAPKPPDPNTVDPNADPLAHPLETPDPSLIDPSKRLDPSNAGAAEHQPPRENADPSAVSPIPPIDAPKADDPRLDPSATGSTPTPATDNATNSTGGAPTTPVPPSPAGAPGDARAEDGALSTRESDASSIIDVPMANWQNGKPLARKGITLQTFRPKFSTLNLIDGIAYNPIVELVVGRDGVPRHVVLSRGSGNPGVNDAIRNSLFKWRATGKQIERLQPGQTVTLRLKLIMLSD